LFLLYLSAISKITCGRRRNIQSRAAAIAAERGLYTPSFLLTENANNPNRHVKHTGKNDSPSLSFRNPLDKNNNSSINKKGENQTSGILNLFVSA